MSRRRKLDPLLRQMIVAPSWRIEVVCRCTGRRRVIGRVTSKNGNAPTFEGVSAAALLTDGDPHTTSVFACTHCRRNLPGRSDSADRFTEATRRGVTEIDLADLGAIA